MEYSSCREELKDPTSGDGECTFHGGNFTMEEREIERAEVSGVSVE
jgi:hypothetical protein